MGSASLLDGSSSPPWLLSSLFEAAVDATEEAVVNALFAAQTVIGRSGNTLHALPFSATVPEGASPGRMTSVALVQPESVGLGLTAYLNVRLEKHTETHKRNPMDVFRASVQTWPEVVECVALTGEMDYLLRVVVQDMAHYSRFIMETLLKHPSVEDCKTSFVLDRVKATTAVPL